MATRKRKPADGGAATKSKKAKKNGKNTAAATTPALAEAESLEEENPEVAQMAQQKKVTTYYDSIDPPSPRTLRTSLTEGGAHLYRKLHCFQCSNTELCEQHLPTLHVTRTPLVEKLETLCDPRPIRAVDPNHGYTCCNGNVGTRPAHEAQARTTETARDQAAAQGEGSSRG